MKNYDLSSPRAHKYSCVYLYKVKFAYQHAKVSFSSSLNHFSLIFPHFNSLCSLDLSKVVFFLTMWQFDNDMRFLRIYIKSDDKQLKVFYRSACFILLQLPNNKKDLLWGAEWLPSQLYFTSTSHIITVFLYKSSSL